jgi:hypothetical protein
VLRWDGGEAQVVDVVKKGADAWRADATPPVAGTAVAGGSTGSAATN